MSGLYGPVIAMNARFDYTVLPTQLGGKPCFKYQVMRDGLLVAEGHTNTEEEAHSLVKRFLLG